MNFQGAKSLVVPNLVLFWPIFKTIYTLTKVNWVLYTWNFSQKWNIAADKTYLRMGVIVLNLRSQDSFKEPFQGSALNGVKL